MSSEPTPRVHEALVDFACDRPRSTIRRKLRENAASRTAEDAKWLSAMVMEAYTEGVRHGYAQAIHEADLRSEEASDDA